MKVVKPDFPQLARSYKEAKAANTQEYQLCGNMSHASAFVASAKKKGGMFGPRGRDCKRFGHKLQRNALWLRGKKKSVVEKAAMHASQAGSLLTLEDAISKAKQQDAMDGAAQRSASKEHVRKVQAWQCQMGPECMRMLEEFMPSFPWSGLPVVPLPAGGGPMIHLTALPSAAATKALGWASSKSLNLPFCLQKEWEEMHEPIAQQPAIVAEERGGKRPCKEAGVCLCDEEGDRLYRLRNKFTKTMKTTFYSKDQKASLCGGQIVCRFVLEAQCGDCAAKHGVLGANEIFFHIAHLSLSPYKPCFHELTRVCPVQAPPVEAEKAIDLQATLQFHTEFLGLQCMCNQCSWGLAWYSLEQSGRPHPSLKPDKVRVLAWNGNPSPVHLWPIRRQRKRPRAQFLDYSNGQAEQIEQPLLDDLGDSDYDEEHEAREMGDMDAHPDCGEANDANELVLLQAEALDFLMALEEEARQQEPEETSSTKGKPPHVAPASEATLGQTAEVTGADSSAAPATTMHVEGSISSALPAHEAASSERVPGVAPVRVSSTQAAASVCLPFGKIAFHYSKMGFEAQCSRHKNCNLSRTALAKGKKKNLFGWPLGGRPVGFLAAWLSDVEPNTKEEHKNLARLCGYTLASRTAARDHVASLPDGTQLLSYERKQEAKEPAEPNELDGYAMR
eukprot:5197117-Amphidinium_carterae.2